MSDENTVAGAIAPAAAPAAPVASPAPAPAPVEATVSINEFCMRLSETATRPELFGAFAHTEKAAGRHSDTTTAFRARFDAFLNQPA